MRPLAGGDVRPVLTRPAAEPQECAAAHLLLNKGIWHRQVGLCYRIGPAKAWLAWNIITASVACWKLPVAPLMPKPAACMSPTSGTDSCVAAWLNRAAQFSVLKASLLGSVPADGKICMQFTATKTATKQRRDSLSTVRTVQGAGTSSACNAT